MQNQIIMSNIGTVLDSDDFKRSHVTYSECIKLSKENYGRFAGETVTWFKDGEIYKEHNGTIEND